MPPRYLLLLLFLVIFMITIIQLEVLSIAFQRLGLSPGGALMLVLGALLGSGINIPVAMLDSIPPSRPSPESPPGGDSGNPSRPGSLREK